MQYVHRISITTLCACAALALLPVVAAAAAEDAPPAAATAPAASDTAPAVTTAAAPEKEAAAFQPFLNIHGEGWHNATGGVKNTGWWNTLVDAGFALDFEKLGGPKGLSLFTNLHWTESRPHAGAFAAHTGAANPVSGIIAESDHLRVFNFHLVQRFAEGRFTVKVGQLAIDDDFMLGDFTGLFLNAAFGAMPSQVATPLSNGRAAFPIFDVASPGVFFAWDPGENFSWQTGIYYGGPGADTRNNYGWKWDSASQSGAVVFTEAAYKTEVASHAVGLKLGLAGHTAKFETFRTGDTTRGLFSGWLVQDVVLVAGKDDKAPPTVAFFAREGLSPQTDRAAVSFYADAGFVFHNLIPGRPDDVLGVALSHTRYGRDFRRANGGLAPSETALELTAAFRITERWIVQLDLQVLFSPAMRDGADSRRTAVVPGVRTVLSF